MAITKLSTKDALTAPASGDIIHVVDDPSGTPVSKKMTLSTLAGTLSGMNLTGTKTAAYTAAVGDHVLVDSNGAAGDFDVTLPASPSDGDMVIITMITDHATRTVGIDRNSSNVQGSTTVTKWTFVLEGDSATFLYVGGDVGWAVEDRIQPHLCMIYQATSSQSISSSSVTKVTMNTTGVNVGGLADLSNNRVTLRRAGNYNIATRTSMGTLVSAGDQHANYTHVNGSTVSLAIVTYQVGPSYVLNEIFQSLAAADYIEVNVWQNAGSARNTYVVSGHESRIILRELR